jgi:hypothetical protein
LYGTAAAAAAAGETWDTAMIAADDVGHNTWELWYLK